MSSTDLRLYANNAKSNLPQSIGISSVIVPVQPGHGSRFPAIVSSDQFFLITLESSGEYEVCKVTGRSGDSLFVERGQEGTLAKAFPLGTMVQMRVTKGILEDLARKTDRLADIDTVDNMPTVAQAKGNSFLCSSKDDGGNPIMAVRTTDRWRFPSHSTVQMTSAVSSATKTSLTDALFSTMNGVPGRYIVTFTTGNMAGYSRVVTSSSGTTLSWDTELLEIPQVGSGFEVLVSNSYQFSLINNAIDESIINAIIFGSE